jgi:hypothetical protein
MKPTILAAFALAIGVGSVAHAGCGAPVCATDERQTTAPQATEATLERRIENALKDLEIINARAFKADQVRINAFCRSANCARPEPTDNTPPAAR